MDFPSPTCELEPTSPVCSHTDKGHILNMSSRVSRHSENPSSADLEEEIASLEVEIANMESYILSLYRAALQRHLSSSKGNHPNHVTGKYGISPRLSSDYISQESRFKMPENCNDRQGWNSPKSDLFGSKDSVLITSPKLFSRRAKKSAFYRSSADRVGNYCVICPDRLSEDIIRCISLVYCKLANPSRTHKSFAASSPASFCSSGMFSPRNLSSSWSPRCVAKINENFYLEGLDQDKGPYSTMIEVLNIYIDNENYSYVASMLQKFRSLVQRLENVDLKRMRREEKLAFWINIHNALVMHAYLAYGTQNYIKATSIEKAAYNVGGHYINAYDIQSSILGIKAHYPAPWLQTLISAGKKFRDGTTKHVYAIEYPEPLVHFALCAGSYTDPSVRIFTAQHVFRDLKVAKEEFIQATVNVHKQAKIYLPKVLRHYAKDMSLDMSALLESVSECLTGTQKKIIQSFAHSRAEKPVYWLEHSSSFRYLIDKEITGMQWGA